jgi:hypothetical protein
VPKAAISWSPEVSDFESGRPWWETQSLTPFEPCSSICVSGPTGAGKTRWVYKLLQHLDGMYVKDTPQQIMYCYGVYQDLFDEMEKNIKNITFRAGLPTEQELTEWGSGLVILDDLMDRVLASKEMEILFTQGCHHRHLSVIFITQNLYGQAKAARTIALNTWYLVLFKNMRDASQISILGRQLFPGKSGVVIESYNDIMKQPYGYLVIDMAPTSDDNLRLRTNIFPGEETIVYVPKL